MNPLKCGDHPITTDIALAGAFGEKLSIISARNRKIRKWHIYKHLVGFGTVFVNRKLKVDKKSPKSRASVAQLVSAFDC